MKTAPLSSEDLYTHGVAALEMALGPENARRFLQEHASRTEDYTTRHHHITDRWTLDEIFQGLDAMHAEESGEVRA